MTTGRPALSAQQSARVVAAMRKLRDERYGGNNAALGRAIGVSGSAVGQLLGATPKNRPSLATAERVADLLGADVYALLSGASLEPVTSDTYPERARALARLCGLLPAEVEGQLRSVVIHEGRRPTELDWIRLALLQVREHEERAQLLSIMPRSRT